MIHLEIDPQLRPNHVTGATRDGSIKFSAELDIRLDSVFIEAVRRADAARVDAIMPGPAWAPLNPIKRAENIAAAIDRAFESLDYARAMDAQEVCCAEVRP